MSGPMACYCGTNTGGQKVHSVGCPYFGAIYQDLSPVAAKIAALEERLRRAERLASALRPRGDVSTALAEALHCARTNPGGHEVTAAIAGALDAARAALHGWDTEESK